uniref:Site-specific recombinase XerD n=1 Tax=Desulfovibrio sp. U5L TaxID=596152 RepID=I2PWN3_9BACT
MPKQERFKTDYPGVYYVMGTAVATGKPEKIFYIYYRKGGPQIEEKAGRQFQDAMTPARAARLRAERLEGKAPSNQAKREAITSAKEAEAGRMTIGRIWEEFQTQKAGLKSARDDKCRWGLYLEKTFSGKEVSEVVTLDIDRVRHKLLKVGKAPATVKQVIVLLKRIVNFGVRKGMCPAPEPSRLHFEMPTIHNETTEDLSPEELARLLAAMDEDTNFQAANLMRMALFTGMRRGELFRLKWEHIDYERGFILLVDTKGGGDQKIPLNEAARALLQCHPRTESEYVFPGRGGWQRTDIRKQVDRIKQRAGLPKAFRPLHGLRHVYASMLASSGQVDMHVLQKLLTHKSPQMTQRYAHLRDDALKRAADVAGEILSGIGNGNISASRVVRIGEGK